MVKVLYLFKENKKDLNPINTPFIGSWSNNVSFLQIKINLRDVEIGKCTDVLQPVKEHFLQI